MDAKQQNNKTMLSFMRLMGNTERLKIAGVLGVESLSADQLAERLDMPLETVQQHLEQLVAAGLVRVQEQRYALESKTLEYLSRQVLAQSHPASEAPDFEGDEFERKVMRSYFARDGSLNSIPNQQKKLVVILRQLAKDFEPGKRYPERQVNEMLSRYHEDFAALRRYMVDNGFMARDNKGEYWKI